MISLGKFINQRKVFAVIGLAAIGLTLAPKEASAFTLVNRTDFTDIDFESLRTQGQFTELFVAEGRMGDTGFQNRSEQEIGILGDTKGQGFTPVERGDRNWVSGQILDFVLEYTGSKVTYSVDGQTLSSSAFNGGASDIFLRTFAKPDGSKSTLSELVFNGTGIGSLQSMATATADTDYLQISNVSTPFKLTGKTSFTWTGSSAPQRSNLAYQIKVGNSLTQSVPEPGMVAAIFVTGAASAINKRKKSC